MIQSQNQEMIPQHKKRKKKKTQKTLEIKIKIHYGPPWKFNLEPICYREGQPDPQEFNLYKGESENISCVFIT